ncbi:MAG: YdcF family protein [Mogibacterium sp.]|nr:YdcF family protein [Mogibacterium sp.]
MFDNIFITLNVICWGLFAISFLIDRSRYRNCALLFIACFFAACATIFEVGKHESSYVIYILGAMIIILLAVPVFLVINGVLMIKREGRSLANLLSLGFGIVIGLGELATYCAVVMPEIAAYRWEASNLLHVISKYGMFVSTSVIYISIAFLAFMLYCVFLQIIPRKRDFDYVIIHGAGLINGNKVSKLLADRLDKAIEIYRKDPTPPILIPSGGKGSDEVLSEAEAMAAYLMEKGIPADMIIKEDKSTTTFENLENSKAIIESREGRKKTVLVTSNYHVYRALRYCRKIGLKCTGVGSHVAFYFWPSALIREYIAIHAEKKHFILLALGWLICILPLILAYSG